jgi:hypothetical protein
VRPTPDDHQTRHAEPLPDGKLILSLIIDAGEQADWRYVVFFTANIRNPNTRRAYARACDPFFAWSDERGQSLTTIRPYDVSQYTECRRHSGSEGGEWRKRQASRRHPDRHHVRSRDRALIATLTHRASGRSGIWGAPLEHGGGIGFGLAMARGSMQNGDNVIDATAAKIYTLMAH